MFRHLVCLCDVFSSMLWCFDHLCADVSPSFMMFRHLLWCFTILRDISPSYVILCYTCNVLLILFDILLSSWCFVHLIWYVVIFLMLFHLIWYVFIFLMFRHLAGILIFIWCFAILLTFCRLSDVLLSCWRLVVLSDVLSSCWCLLVCGCFAIAYLMFCHLVDVLLFCWCFVIAYLILLSCLTFCRLIWCFAISLWYLVVFLDVLSSYLLFFHLN